ncbi:MAG TPA: DNA polymerase III subunit delta [Burkholderiales bacterium]|nr:DNA polymerase III subunit delta [Burkholderiales bacterium]
MRVKPEQLVQHLARDLQPLYCVYGDEPLLVLESADRIRKAARDQGYQEREIHQAEGRFNWQNLLQIGNNLSLFGDRRFIELRIPSGKPGNDGSKVLQAYCAALPPDSVTLITLPKLDRTAVAARWFGAIEQYGAAVAVYPVSLEQMPRWIGDRLALQHQRADPETLRFLAQKVEGNLLAAQQEIRKLALLFPEGPLDFASVRDAVLDVARYDVFKLADALLAGDIARLVRILDGLRNEGETATLALWAVTRELRMLHRLKAAPGGGSPSAHLLRDAGVWENRQPAVKAALQRIRPETLTQCLRQTAAIDRMIKGLDQNDPWTALKQLALDFSLQK